MTTDTSSLPSSTKTSLDTARTSSIRYKSTQIKEKLHHQVSWIEWSKGVKWMSILDGLHLNESPFCLFDLSIFSLKYYSVCWLSWTPLWTKLGISKSTFQLPPTKSSKSIQPRKSRGHSSDFLLFLVSSTIWPRFQWILPSLDTFTLLKCPLWCFTSLFEVSHS